MPDGISPEHLLEHQLVRAGINRHHQTGDNKAVTALQEFPCLFQGATKPHPAVPEIGNQQKYRQHDVIQRACNGEPLHAFSERQQNNLVRGHRRIRHQLGNGRIFGLKPGLEPIIQRIKYLEDKSDAVQCHDRNGQRLPLVHNAYDADDSQSREQAGNSPQKQGCPDCFAFLLRMIHEVFDEDAVDAKRAEGGKKGRIRRRVIDQTVIARSQVACRKNADHKSQQFVCHLAGYDPACVFDDFILSERL